MRGFAAPGRRGVRALLPGLSVRPLGQQVGAGSDGGSRARMRRTGLKAAKTRPKRKRAAAGRAVLLLGAGRMGSALLKGWLAAKQFSTIYVVEPAPSAALKSLARERGITLSPDL